MPGFKWASPWKLDRDYCKRDGEKEEGCDEAGWSYNVDFDSLEKAAESGKSKRSGKKKSGNLTVPIYFARRRKWTRPMELNDLKQFKAEPINCKINTTQALSAECHCRS